MLSGHVWLSLVTPKLKAETKIRKAVNDCLSPGRFRPMVIRVIVWLPGLFTRNSALT